MFPPRLPLSPILNGTDNIDAQTRAITRREREREGGKGCYRLLACISFCKMCLAFRFFYLAAHPPRRNRDCIRVHEKSANLSPTYRCWLHRLIPPAYSARLLACISIPATSSGTTLFRNVRARRNYLFQERTRRKNRRC